MQQRGPYLKIYRIEQPFPQPTASERALGALRTILNAFSVSDAAQDTFACYTLS